MGAMASQITSLTFVYWTIYSGADQRKHQSSASLASVRGIHRWPVNSPHEWPVTRKMFPFDDVIMCRWGLATWHIYMPARWVESSLLVQVMSWCLFSSTINYTSDELLSRHRRWANISNLNQITNIFYQKFAFESVISQTSDILSGPETKWKHFCVTVPLWGECTGHRWIPLTKASDAEVWCFLWPAPEQTL